MDQQAVILCVDDEPINLAYLEGVLAPRGYRVILARDGEEAMVRLAGERIDLVLLDVMMPGLDGFAVCRLIKGNSTISGIPVLFVTSLEDDSCESSGLALGAADYLTKPIVPAVLVARVQTNLALKAHRDRLEVLAETRARQLLHAERLSTIGTLTAGIIHELNSPLTFVIGFAKVLLEDMQELAGQLPPSSEDETGELAAFRQFLEKDTELVVRMVDGAGRIRRIMESMRKFSRRDQQEKSPVSLVGCIENALVLCNNALKYQVTVQKNLDVDLPPVMANAQQLEQVFVNLFKNAADAMNQKRNGVLTITLARENGVVRCIVEDNGPGIDQKELTTIWEPFFTTKDAESGTGLGLSVSRGIIEEHHGRIWSENREQGEGARFVVEVPVCRENVEREVR